VSTIEERLAQKAIDAPKAHSTCRAPFNHDWVEYESTRNPEGGGWYLTMRCSKCGTIFRQIIDLGGMLLSGRRYSYPADYRDKDKWSRSDWRRNFLARLNGR
jgi:hypothetical protein